MTIQDLSFPLAIATFYGCMCTHAENNGLAAIALGVLVLVLADLTILLVYTIVEGTQGNLTVIRVPNMEKCR